MGNKFQDNLEEKEQETHPCFSESASCSYARIHIPVAPKCNIQCNYCDRKYNCPNENRPGVTTKIFSPIESLRQVIKIKKQMSNVSVVGVAGPGEALANPKNTFNSLYLIRKSFPYLNLCISTNGLELPNYLGRIIRLGIKYVSITINALKPEIGAKIYSWVKYKGKTFHDIYASSILIACQEQGIYLLSNFGIRVKINTVFIPGINDDHILEIAKRVSKLGALVLNIIPIIPLNSTIFSKVTSPSSTDLQIIRSMCSKYLPVISHCRLCRADAVGMIRKVG